jgi:uncharacterized protein (DUF1800 family)
MKPLPLPGQIVASSVLSFLLIHSIAAGAEMNPAPPLMIGKPGTNGPAQFIFPYPAAQQYQVFSTTDPSLPFTEDNVSGKLLGPLFQVTNGGPQRFYKVSATPMNSNDVFIANVLNRLTYGPTPDDLDHIRAVGAQTFINEQMAAEAIADTINTAPPITNTPIAIPPAPPLTNWIRVSATGLANANTNIFIYLTGAGRVYVDDVRMVLGTNADTGTDLLGGTGDFEDPVLTNNWLLASMYTGSVATNSPTVDGLAALGTNCLLVVGTSAGSGNGAAVQRVFGATNYPASQRVTISFSYLPVRQATTNPVSLVVRLSSNTTITNVLLPPSPPPPPTPPTPPPAINVAYGKLANTNAVLDDLRAWHIYRAIHSPRQLHEILAQFFQNHLTTQYQKTKDYFDNNFNAGTYTNDAVRQNVSVELHWREHQKIREALLNPNCTFYDLLKISIESPAMIIYLDTILNTRSAPNQNYGREILELHTMGADNGYIQQDIVELAKVWTGWQVKKKDASVADNPFAAAISGTSSNIATTPGIWALHYNPGTHESNAVKRLFTNNVIDPRFGPAFGGGTSYALIISNGAPAAFTNGFAEGYRVASHLATLPYTMEFVSVKLCQLFVHEGFEYGRYDYTAPDAPPEALLVRDCMTAWNTAAPGDGRKGNIRSVLNVIFNSAMFRGQGAAQQKVKTPLEYSVSAIRAIRITSTDTNDWISATSDSDGYGIITPLSRMGGMTLFNKAEPDGWSEKGSIWLNTANLCERMRYVQSYMMSTANSLKSTDGSAGTRNTSDPVGLLRLKLLSGSLNDPAAVVDYFMGLLFPGEGAANLAIDRDAAIRHLDTAENGSASPFNLLNSSTTTYDGRVRSMVGFLLSLPRFHEQ